MHDDTHAALVRLFWTWLLVGLSQMTPLQFMQFVAAIAATIYTIAQFYVLMRDKILRKRHAHQ